MNILYISSMHEWLIVNEKYFENIFKIIDTRMFG